VSAALLAARARLAGLLDLDDDAPIPPLADLVDQLAARAEQVETTMAPAVSPTTVGLVDTAVADATWQAARFELTRALDWPGGAVPPWHQLLGEITAVVADQRRTRWALRNLLATRNADLDVDDLRPLVDVADLVGDVVDAAETQAADAREASARNRRQLDELRGHLALALGRSTMAPLSDNQLVDSVRTLARLRADIATAVERDPSRLGDFELVDRVAQSYRARGELAQLRRASAALFGDGPELDTDLLVDQVRKLAEQTPSRTWSALAELLDVEPGSGVTVWRAVFERVRQLLAAQNPRELAMPDEPGPEVEQVWTHDQDTGDPITWLRDLDNGRPQGWVREAGGGHLFWSELLTHGPVLLDDPRPQPADRVDPDFDDSDVVEDSYRD
jgi:hypothetical protein